MHDVIDIIHVLLTSAYIEKVTNECNREINVSYIALDYNFADFQQKVAECDFFL